jgi:hypothetical protein
VAAVWVALYGALASSACGHTTEDAPTAEPSAGVATSAPSVGGNASTTRGGTSAQAGSVTRSGAGGVETVVPPDATSGSGGAPTPLPHPAVPCQNPEPLPTGGGYEVCADGSLRRSRPAECVSALPRAEPAEGRRYEECEYDADCSERPHGFCTIGACFYGCVADAECGAGSVCFCADIIGSCHGAACASDDDCPADYPCTGNPASASDIDFRCQTPLDECQTDGDCNPFDARVHCVSDGERRACIRLVR